MLHVVLIDSKRLRVLRDDPDGALVEVLAAEDSQAVPHERDLRADRPGRTINAAAGSHVAFSSRHTARSLSLQGWLKATGVTLRDLIAGGQCSGIVMVASSRLLGLLRVTLPIEVRRQVLVEVARDLAKQSPATLQKRLRPELLEATRRLRRRPVAAAGFQRFRAGD